MNLDIHIKNPLGNDQLRLIDGTDVNAFGR